MRTPLLAALACTLSLGTSACEGKLVEIVPKDLSAHIAGDAGSDGGGSMVDLGPPHFATDIQKTLDTLSCATNPSGCHQAPNGNDPKFINMATTEADIMANYTAFMAESTPSTPGDNTTTPILQNPLDTAPGISHSGGVVFTSTSDPTYQLWLTYLNDGSMY